MSYKTIYLILFLHRKNKPNEDVHYDMSRAFETEELHI